MRITAPTLVLDKKKCLLNIERMVAKAKRNQVVLRPHFKTHQSAQVGEWFKAFGVTSITVSSLQMARYFASHGWKDIMVAFPANVLEIDLINELAAKITLHLVVVNPETVELLANRLHYPVKLWLKIDAGYRRTGLSPHDHPELDQIIGSIDSGKYMTFGGFVVHDGHTYKQSTVGAIRTIHKTSVFLLQSLRGRYIKQYPDLKLSIGDTPSCSVLENMEGVDEIRPGNFVFYDLTQQRIGSCSYEQIAVCMACPIVAKHPDRNEFIIYGGSVHFSKDSLLTENGTFIFGRVVDKNRNGWSAPIEGAEVVALSQEHGTVRVSSEMFERYDIGDLMYVLPVHSCLTADAMRAYLTLEGEWLEHLSGLSVADRAKQLIIV
ncbi:alanine racemase [Pontibacter sp. SGAir0037]|uniref:alanine racemase n=1 Tax=Pontibacter sp. SGAir0037 TaxID=2571030 RepID=UPI0010CCD6E6|nr:alanine racemase [Pontibacter sp. SGAir0037]QCR23126.1 alanine racemase [Pontibacter sp. SGAir0037]